MKTSTITESGTTNIQTSSLPKLPISKIWMINFGFLGVQMAFSLQSSNMGRIFQTLGANPNNLGWFFIVPPLAVLIIQPLVGKYSDRTWIPHLGRRIPYLILGILVAFSVLLLLPNAGSFGFSFTQALWFGALAITFLDLSNNVSMQPYKMMIADMVEEDQRGLAYSIQGFFSNSGSILASVIPFVLTALGIANIAPKGEVPLSVKIAFYIGATVLILSSLVTIFKVKEYSPEQYNLYHHISQEELKEKKSFLTLLKEAPKIFWVVSLIQFFSWFGFQYLWTYATGAISQNIWNTEVPASSGFQAAGNWYGIMSAVQAISAVIWSLVLTRVTNKSSKLVYSSSLIAGATGLILMAVLHDRYFLVVSFILIGIAWASMHTFPFTLVSNAINGSNMGAYLGLFNGSICVPQIAASLLSFVLFPVLGSSFPVMIAVAGIAMGIGAIIVHFVNSNYFGK
ncbi:SLC45 family MFS transporter [Lentilactobacillus hilgardii]|uniref:SLC45 family MFS transporter n=1 Tax=Lentilactobacillus hilgardii TaxID=1588 RepID=UPI00390CC96D